MLVRHQILASAIFGWIPSLRKRGPNQESARSLSAQMGHLQSVYLMTGPVDTLVLSVADMECNQHVDVMTAH